MDRPELSPLRIVVLGDGRWAALSLRALRAAGHDLCGAALRERPSDGSLADAAGELGVTIFRPQRSDENGLPAWIGAMRPDLIVSVAFDQILRRPVRARARLGALNFHAGKLPFYRGRNVINWAIINGEAEIGITGHWMDDGIDTGDIVLQRTLPIGWTDTYGEVLHRVADAIPSLVVDTVALVAEGRGAGRSQRHLAGTYCGGRGPGDEWFDWSATSEYLHNFIRAITSPGPGARTSLHGEEIIVWAAFFDRAWPRYLGNPGQVVGRSPGGVVVKTGDSTLLVTDVESDAGGRCVPAWPIGTRLDVDRHSVVPARFP
jgi:methionyl-tRNA formyltransferase